MDRRPQPARRDGVHGDRRLDKPTRDEVAAAGDRIIPDLVGDDLRVLFSGINPSLYSAATGHHFARPGNRFWPALYRSGFTPRLLHPSEQFELPALGLGITNVVARASARADELSSAELIRGGETLASLAERWRPRFLAVLGVTAYRVAFGRPKAVMGPQDHEIGGVRIWVLPNPSGLNAHYSAEALATAFAELRETADASPPTRISRTGAPTVAGTRGPADTPPPTHHRQTGAPAGLANPAEAL
jgi:TDG/mug DNA glycosylase family protein